MVAEFIFELCMAPAEWLVERIWRVHRKEPAWRRWFGGAVLVLASILVVVLYIAALIAIPIGIYLLVTRAG